MTSQKEAYIESLRQGNLLQHAAAFAIAYGDIEGAHYKQWIIDQMLRIICGAAYKTAIKYFESDGSRWDCGIAP